MHDYTEGVFGLLKTISVDTQLVKSLLEAGKTSVLFFGGRRFFEKDRLRILIL